MAALESDLRGSLEKAVIEPRDQAEAAASAALVALAVDREDAFASLDVGQRQLRNALRVRGRQLGGGCQSKGFEP